MIKDCPNFNCKQYQLGINECWINDFIGILQKIKILGFKENMVTRLKLKGIDEKAPLGVELIT